MANYDVGGPTDEQLEAHLRPQTDDDPDTLSPADVPPQVEEPLPIDLVYPHEFGLLRTEDD